MLSNEQKLWRNAIIVAIITFVLLNIYDYFYMGSVDIYVFNRSLANAAIIMIGLSFCFSGLAYFFKLRQDIFIHRKYLGLTGFWLGLIHSLFSGYNYFINVNSPKPAFEFLHTWNIFGTSISNIYSFIPAVFGILIFIFMSIITNKFAIKRLGKNWRPALRVGYIAYVFVIIHFTIKRLSTWLLWFRYHNTLPHITLILGVFAWFVIFLRIALFFSEMRKKQHPLVST
jgi:DMSO/TMAO reductase YedYZ heme-binding membrane subunit